jgi:hypothetical protein
MSGSLRPKDAVDCVPPPTLASVVGIYGPKGGAVMGTGDGHGRAQVAALIARPSRKLVVLESPHGGAAASFDRSCGKRRRVRAPSIRLP